MSVYDRFNRLLQGRAPVPQANIMRPYQTPQGMTPPMALPRPTPPQSPMLANQRLSPLMQQVLKNAQASRMTPRAGQVGLPTPETAATGQPATEMTFGQKLMQPRTQGMLGAAAAGFEASGYQDRPVSLGQVLGRMGTAGMKAYTAAEDRQTKLAASLAAAQRQKRLDEEKAAYDAEMLRLKGIEVGGASGKEAFGNEKQLRSEFDKQAKNFDEARLGFEKVQKAAMAETASGPTDLALIFGYMKVIDPTSVVREGEFATAEKAGGVSEQLRNLYNKVRTGERLTQDVRDQFVQAARTQFQPYMDMQRNIESRYTNLATSYNLDPTKVVLSRIPKVGTLANPYTTFATEADADAANLPKGTYVMIGGELYVEE